jgi:hypothetical protein
MRKQAVRIEVMLRVEHAKAGRPFTAHHLGALDPSVEEKRSGTHPMLLEAFAAGCSPQIKDVARKDAADQELQTRSAIRGCVQLSGWDTDLVETDSEKTDRLVARRTTSSNMVM